MKTSLAQNSFLELFLDEQKEQRNQTSELRRRETAPTEQDPQGKRLSFTFSRVERSERDAIQEAEQQAESQQESGKSFL
jgi:hypothetical protein